MLVTLKDAGDVRNYPGIWNDRSIHTILYKNPQECHCFEETMACFQFNRASGTLFFNTYMLNDRTTVGNNVSVSENDLWLEKQQQ